MFILQEVCDTTVDNLTAEEILAHLNSADRELIERLVYFQEKFELPREFDLAMLKVHTN